MEEVVIWKYSLFAGKRFFQHSRTEMEDHEAMWNHMYVILEVTDQKDAMRLPYNSIFEPTAGLMEPGTV